LTTVMTEWQGFVKNHLRLQGADMIGPNLICINVQPHDPGPADSWPRSRRRV
jgi:hypothetical protein